MKIRKNSRDSKRELWLCGKGVCRDPTDYGFRDDTMYTKRVSKTAFDIEKMQKQSIALSIVLTADKIATERLFKDGQYISLDEAKKVLIDRNELSDNERCYQYILDKIAMNGQRFDVSTNCEKWGNYRKRLCHILQSGI